MNQYLKMVCLLLCGTFFVGCGSPDKEFSDVSSSSVDTVKDSDGVQSFSVEAVVKKITKDTVFFADNVLLSLKAEVVVPRDDLYVEISKYVKAKGICKSVYKVDLDQARKLLKAVKEIRVEEYKGSGSPIRADGMDYYLTTSASTKSRLKIGYYNLKKQGQKFTDSITVKEFVDVVSGVKSASVICEKLK